LFFRYTVMSGTPEKILEHLLETLKLDSQFTESGALQCLSFTYHAQPSQGSEQERVEYALNNKRRVIRLVLQWAAINTDHLQEEDSSFNFLQEFNETVCEESRLIPALKDQLPELEKIIRQNCEEGRPSQKKHKVLLRQFSTGNDRLQKKQPIRSTDENKELLKPSDVSIFSSLSINGRLFVCPRDQIDSLHELIYHTFGRQHFKKTTANLDLFLRRFNEVQLWVVTEVCLCPTLSKRVQLLKKFIKIAAHCKEFRNLNSFFAIIMGLGNPAKLPSKFKKSYGEFENLMDPSRNHRAYRLTMAKLEPPIIPFMPLLIKDMTFTHEGNKTFTDRLVNFEKMRMIASTVRIMRYCRSQPFNQEAPQATGKSHQDVRSYVRHISVIDNQRTLSQLSHRLEPRRT
ncbi:hypothetical protein cypCar_00038535, partial [Cyprinus carpio]